MSKRVAVGLDDKPMAFRQVEDIRKTFNDTGSFWFSPDTMRVFGTRLDSKVYGGRIFVASHMNAQNDRRLYNVHIVERSYSVRESDDARMVEYTIQNAFMLSESTALGTMGMARAVAQTLESWELPEYFSYDDARMLEWLIAEKVYNAGLKRG